MAEAIVSTSYNLAAGAIGFGASGLVMTASGALLSFLHDTAKKVRVRRLIINCFFIVKRIRLFSLLLKIRKIAMTI